MAVSLINRSVRLACCAAALALAAASGASARHDKASWEQSPYNAPVVVETPDEIRIATQNSPAGLYFRRTLDPSSRYDLEVVGACEGFSMRLRFDEGSYEYHSAPGQPYRRTVAGTRTIEALFYSDAPATCSLSRISLQECANCHADAWTKAPYGQPDLTETEAGLRIQVERAPAGLFFRKLLDPGKRYRFSAVGTCRAFSVRMRRDDRPFEYLGGTDQLSRTISGVRDFEALIYSDKPATCDLSEIEIKECPTCKTAADLQARIRADIPDLDAMPTIDKARALLHWASTTLNWTVEPGTAVAHFQSISLVDSVYDVFDRDVGGIICGGAAVYYSNVLHEFGIDAFTIDIGPKRDPLTHVTVVIPFDGKFLLYDPTFAMHYEQDGRDIDMFSILTDYRAGHSLAASRSYSIASRKVLFKNEDREACGTNIWQSNGWKICRLGSTDFLQRYFRAKAMAGKLSRHGIAPDHFALIALLDKGIFGVGPALDPKSREAFMRRAREAGLTFWNSTN